jgi:lipoyl(octanoyl) transferase
MNAPVCEVHRLGLIDYQEAWDLQNWFAAVIAAGERSAILLLLEHPHTYTFWAER